MARKRKWTPVKPVAGKCKEGAEEAITVLICPSTHGTACWRFYHRCTQQ